MSLEKEREKKKNTIIWTAFVCCAGIFTASLVFAINQTYSNAFELTEQRTVMEESYQDSFGDDL